MIKLHGVKIYRHADASENPSAEYTVVMRLDWAKHTGFIFLEAYFLTSYRSIDL